MNRYAGLLFLFFFLVIGAIFIVAAYEGKFDKDYTLTSTTTVTQQYDDATLRSHLTNLYDAQYVALERIAQLEMRPAALPPVFGSSAYCVAEEDSDSIVLRCKRFD
jgi:hypothetical protein